MARIGYGKIGRSFNLDPAKATSVGGDIDVLNLLNRLARKYPQHQFVLVGKNSGESPRELGYPTNIVNPWTEWRDQWEMAADPRLADRVIENFRKISGNIHETLDSMIVWAGQHGSANSRIPMIGSDWVEGQSPADLFPNEVCVTGGTGENLATPQYAFIHYISWYLDLIGRWREAGPGPLEREEIWLCPDPRNYLKCRELRWPPRFPVLAQYDFLRYHKGERYGRFPPELAGLDPTGYREQSRWVTNVAYCYSGLELTAVGAPDTVAFDPRPGPHRLGLVLNENLTGVKDSRLAILQDWIFPNFPDVEIRGHWTEPSQLKMNRIIDPVPYPDVSRVMKSFATTLTTPASGSEWATAKPWEAFALGSVCFFHPRYDGQGHILPLKDGTGRYQDDRAKTLSQFLRIDSAEQLVERVNEVMSQPELYYTIVTEQRRHYEASFARWEGGALAVGQRIEQELNRDEPLQVGTQGGPWLFQTEPESAKVASRGAARPRGTNEERKHKAPVSRRRRLRGELTAPIVQGEEPIPEASTGGERIVETVAPIELPRGETVLSFTGPGSIIANRITSVTSPPISVGWGFSQGPMSFLGTSKTAEPAPSARPSKDRYFVDMAKHVATQATCARRSVGCVLVDANKKVLATGYNGVPRGFPHCNEGNPCPGANAAPGTELDACYSAHAEMNAVAQCADVMNVQSVYLTVSPCVACVKVLLNTGATRVVFEDEYVQPAAKELWLRRAGNEWIEL